MKTFKNISVLIMGNHASNVQELHFSLSAMEVDSNLVSVPDFQTLLNFLNLIPKWRPKMIILDATSLDCLAQIQTIRACDACDDLTIAVYDPSASCLEEELFAAGVNVYIHHQKDLSHLQDALRKILSVNWHFFRSSLNRDTFFYYA